MVLPVQQGLQCSSAAMPRQLQHTQQPRRKLNPLHDQITTAVLVGLAGLVKIVGWPRLLLPIWHSLSLQELIVHCLVCCCCLLCGESVRLGVCESTSMCGVHHQAE